MELSIRLGTRDFQVKSEAIDIAIPLRFNGPQPNTYGVPHARSRPFEGSGFIGDVRQGGSCNFDEYTFVPHCNGTHTECVGHIATERIAIHQVLADSFIPANLVSVVPVSASESDDSYDPLLKKDDNVIDRVSLTRAIADCDPDFLEALIIRTLPNPPAKKERDYMKNPPPFFTLEAMQFIRSLGVRHLLLDMPSVDRLFDEGKLSAHRIYWEVKAGETVIPAETRSTSTITEMIYAPDEVPDGPYMLNLQIAPFVADAAPSRPRLFEVSEC